MDVWNDITKKISEAVNYTAKETGKLTGIAKIKYKMINLRSKRASLYEDIGKLRYEELRSVPTDDGVIDNSIEISALCDAVTAINVDINTASEELDELRDITQCASCGTKIRPGMSFCPICGAKQA